MSLTVADRARAIATFRFVEVRLMEIAATWTPLTPEMEVKVVLGRHIWDFAQHADWLGKRTFELRQPEHYTLRPAEEYAQLLDEVLAANGTSERLSAMYDVFLPSLSERYRRFIANTDPLLDAPSVVVAERIVGEMKRMGDEASKVRQELSLLRVPLDALAGRERACRSIVATGAA